MGELDDNLPVVSPVSTGYTCTCTCIARKPMSSHVHTTQNTHTCTCTELFLPLIMLGNLKAVLCTILALLYVAADVHLSTQSFHTSPSIVQTEGYE